MPTTTPRLGITVPVLADGPPDIPDALNDIVGVLDDAVMYDEGAFASRPVSSGGSPGLAGRIFRATDTGAWYRDTGTGWESLGKRPDGDITAAEIESGAKFTTGDIKPTLKAAADPGWEMMQGQDVSRTGAYAALFALIGTAFGAGNGTTTFTLPDARGRMLVGKGTHADVDSFADNEGISNASVGSRTPKHSHTVNSHAHTVASHSHSYVLSTGIVSGNIAVINPQSMGSYAGTPAWACKYSLSGTNNGAVEMYVRSTDPASPATDAQSPGTSTQVAPYMICNWMVKL